MSQPGREYRLEWIQANVKNGFSDLDITGRTIRVSIFQTGYQIPDADDPEVIPLTPVGEPLTIETINNDRNKFQVVRAKQATIRFKSDMKQQQVIDTFCDKPDNEWYVEITDVSASKFIFKGFLMLSDMQRPMQPDPNENILTATDHLGILKDKPLVDFDGLNPIGKYRIADIIAFCLAQTGMTLEIKVINNLRHGSAPITASTTFVTSPNEIITTNAAGIFFYPGQRIAITGTASNNGTFTVIDVGIGIVTIVTLLETVTSEASVNATFTDVTTAGHIYDKIYLDAKTFENEIGTCVDCYKALEIIFGYDCFITQWLGVWYIMRVDEFDGNDIFVASFDANGSYNSISSATQITKEIGRLKSVKFVNADNIMQPDRPYKQDRLNFSFKLPIEIVCNIDFSRGDLISATDPLDKTYELDCWTLLEGVPGYYGTVDGTTVTIHRIYDANNYEKQKYITLTPRTTFETSSINDATYIQSQPIPVLVNDKFMGSIDYRLTVNTAGIASARLFRFVLHGKDGSWWILGEATTGDGIPVWYDTANWTLFSGKGNTDVDFSVADWKTISWEAPAVPVTGDLYVWVNQINQNSASYDNQDIQFSNLRFEYIPYINGSYQKYTGYYNQVTRAIEPEKYNARLEEEVFLGDSPNPNFKGSMFFLTGGTYYLTANFYSSAQFALSPPPDSSYINLFGWFQIQAVWNQNRNNTRFFDGSVLGLGEFWADLLMKFTLTDINPNMQDRYFMLISFGQNWKNQVWSAVLSECYRISEGRIYTDTFENKYISE